MEDSTDLEEKVQNIYEDSDVHENNCCGLLIATVLILNP